MLLIFLSTLLVIFTYPPFNVYWLAFIFLVPLFWFLLREKRLFRLLFGTLVFRLVVGGFVAVEAIEPILFIQSASLFLVLPISLWILNRFSVSETIRIALLPLFYTLAEFAQAQFSFLPFIKGYAGVNLAASPFLGLARWGGVLLLSFFVVAINVLIVAALKRSRRNATEPLSFLKVRFDDAGKGLLVATVGLIVLGFLLSQEGLRERNATYQARTNTVRVALVSTAETFDKEIEDYSDRLSKSELADMDKLISDRLDRISKVLKKYQFDLIAFPEELFRNDYRGDEDSEAREKFGITNAGTLIRAYRALARDMNSEVMAYFSTLTADGKRYNSGIVFASDGTISNIYNKRYLAYTGEYWPFGSWKPPYPDAFIEAYPNIVKRSPVFDEQYRYDRGKSDPLLALKNGTRFATPMCSEGHYPFYLKELVDTGAQFIINTSSNNWVHRGFGKFRESVIRFRQVQAVWLGVPILVNGRREYAGVIEPDGSRKLIDFEGEGGFVIYNADIRL